MKNFKNILAELIATSFYIGKIKYCPGTFGSLVAFPIYIAIFYFIIYYQIMLPLPKTEIPGQQIISAWLILFIINILLYFIGLYFVKIYLEYLKSCNEDSADPKQVVIDEVVGQLLVICLCAPSLFICPIKNIFYMLLIFFVLFRLFDILKPWPICWFDQNIKGAQGIMIDDIVAAVFASVSYYTIALLLTNFS